jgi:hypothetical protein
LLKVVVRVAAWRGRWGTAALVALVLSSRPAVAEDPNAQVDASIRKAVDLRRQGKDREALDELQQAARLANPPRLTAQIGLAEQALGLWPAAEKHLQQALDQASDPWVHKHRSTLDESMTFVQGRLATLDVWGVPDGAEILVNGESVGTLPLPAPLRVTAGTTQLSVRAKGYTPSVRTLELAVGANQREHVVLLAQEATAPPAEPAAPAPATAVSAVSLSPQPAAADERPSIFGRWWFWTLAGAVVAGGVTAVVLATRKSGGGCTTGDTCIQW